MLINRPSPAVYRLAAAASRRAVTNLSVSTHRVGQQDRRPPPPKVLPPPPPPPRKALIPIPQLIDSMTEAIQNGKNGEARNIAAAVLERRTEMAGSLAWSDITVLMWGLCALKEKRMMTELIEGLGIDTLMRECPPVELGYMAHYMSLDEGSNSMSRRMAASAVSRMVEGGAAEVDVESLLVALRVFTDRDFAERKGTDCTTELDWGLLVPALRALSSPEALERISTDDLINCLLGTGIARSFEVAPDVLGVFLKTAAERLGMTDEAPSLEDRAKIYRAACRNILVDNEDAARARESVAANFDDGKVLAQLPLAICMSDVLSPALHSQVEDSGRRERIAVACVRDILNPMTRDDWFLLSLDELTIVAKACFDAAMASVPGWLREQGMPAYLGVLLSIGRTRREEVAHRGMGYVNLRGAPVYDLSAFVRLMSATRIFHYKALGTIADVICDAPLEDISLKVCFRTLRASSSLRWYEQEMFTKISTALLTRVTESGGIFSDDRPDTRLLHLAPAIYHLALSAHISPELASAIMEEFQDTTRVSKRLQQWATVLATEGGADEQSAMRRLVGASTQMVWAAAAMRFISQEGMLPATITKPVFEMLVDLADSEGMSSQKLGSLAAINDMYKFSSDLTFALREAELRREGPLRSRATEWLRGKLGASGASFTEAFADNELTGGYTVDIVIGDPSNKHGVLVAPRNACYRSHLDGRRDRAPMVTQLNVAALKKLGWKVGIIYEALLEPAKSTQNLSDDTGMTSELRKAGVLPTEE